jgi:hypothetical protein
MARPVTPVIAIEISNANAIILNHSQPDTAQFLFGIVAALHCRDTGDVPLWADAHGATQFTAASRLTGRGSKKPRGDRASGPGTFPHVFLYRPASNRRQPRHNPDETGAECVASKLKSLACNNKTGCRRSGSASAPPSTAFRG